MTSFERLETRLPALLDELATPRLPDYADDLFARTAATRQRPGWTFPERWISMSAITGRFAFVPRLPWRLGVALALLLVAAIIGMLVAGSVFTRPAPPFGPARNGSIVYISKGDIYAGDPIAGTSRLLVGGPENDRYPVLSPDGTRFAFVRDVSGQGATLTFSIYVAHVDGSNVQRVTSAPMLDQDVPWFGWTPDGKQLAIIHADAGNMQLDLIDAGTGATTRIAAAAGINSLTFRPPDGKELLFRACVTQNSDGSGTDCGLYAMNADGSNVHQVLKPATTGDSLDLTGAVYSADGSRIFYNRWTPNASHGDPGCCHLFVANADGTNEHPFVPNDGTTGIWDGLPQVSPDGQYVAFLHTSWSGVSVIRADGSGEIVKTGPPMAGGAHWMWSPDSSKILVYPEGYSADTNPYLLAPTGGAGTKLTWSSGGDLAWQRLAP